ncbi:MAG: hypothetical protein AB4426_10615 [Xenococcaceae cyanobacterium]
MRTRQQALASLKGKRQKAKGKSRERGRGNRQQATGNRQQGIGNRQQATGNSKALRLFTFLNSGDKIYVRLLSNLNG